MKIVKYAILSVLLALIFYGIYMWLRKSYDIVSPLPKEGIKVIQISPTEK